MYRLNLDRSFQVDDFQNKAPFSSFLPGIAGEKGIPVWAFYVNRGQGIASFGIQDKDHAIMEFHPADKTYQTIYQQGFRTFLKINGESGAFFVEPFSATESSNPVVTESMRVQENALSLRYQHKTAGIDMDVDYVTIPGEAVGGLIRHVTIKNITDAPQQIELLDGMPKVMPSGVSNAAYKELGNTLKSWFDVEEAAADVAFYTLRGSMGDTAEVKEIHEGNFYASMVVNHGQEERVAPVTDPSTVFGMDTSLQVPKGFIENGIERQSVSTQQTTNRVACGFTPVQTTLEPGEAVTILTLIGHGRHKGEVATFVENLFTKDAMLAKKEQAVQVTDELTNAVACETAYPVFDSYARQNYLDNGLRGGFPKAYGQDPGQVFYLYSRKHGDLERDYNFFSISPTFYSQGNGNYRDVNQNRRCDVLFEPRVHDSNVRQFMSLIQLDGYNPLVVKGTTFKAGKNLPEVLRKAMDHDDAKKLEPFFTDRFTPGELLHAIEDQGITLREDFEVLLQDVLKNSLESIDADHGEGFWVDHWTYNLDLIDSFLGVYPDQAEAFFTTKNYPFYHSPARILPRQVTYRMVDGKGLRQYDAIEEDEEMLAAQKRGEQSLWLTDASGERYETNLFSKLLLLAATKTAAIAPFGLGIEMEAGKPGWNDSLNGLPGLLGASTSELMELKRLLNLLEKNGAREAHLPVEAVVMIKALTRVIEAPAADEIKEWDERAQVREAFRSKLPEGPVTEGVLNVNAVRQAVTAFRKLTKKSVDAVNDYGELIPTYVYFELDGELPENGDFSELALKPVAVTPFLEGIVKKMKVSDPAGAKQLYDQVKSSNLFDQKLNMYKTSMPIKDETSDIGRAKAFTPGWLENESIFLHMAYKYHLETLKSGLYEDFYQDIHQALIPFLDPEMYGRSTLENSSFIASSANPDATVHGRGFVARLSGSTVEFLQMWLVMMGASKPFTVAEGQLKFQLNPALPADFFTDQNTVSFQLFKGCEVTYHNPDQRSTFGENAVKPVSYSLTYLDAGTEECQADEVLGKRAEAIRNGEVSAISVQLA
ncbi:hypothetical protein [Salisediminibacterium beveridgei]|uniref:Cellobiose phosphorylase n=1 Tax=Salisediminibacterium beveridgei TaxID=632773 RepID=A0A1D7QZ85_9BACI|nr:hypothetical protein [Salisediminibacterium beveridgei]AOM84332.1 hypothetical protein BBEV_3013 [Salisediminibacterium beveridgei]